MRQRATGTPDRPSAPRPWLTGILLVLALPCLLPAATVTTIYDASLGTLPTAQGFTANVTSPIVPVVNAGVLDVDGYTQGVNSRDAYYTGSNGTFLFSSFVMEADLQIFQSTQRGVPNGGNYPRGGFALGASDNNQKFLHLMVSETGAWLQTSDGTGLNPTGTPFLAFDTTDTFHTYRVETNGSTAKLYMDHALTASLTLNLSNLTVAGDTASTVSFGDESILTRSNFGLEYFMYSSDLSATGPSSATPEPGTAFLMLPAAALLWRLRRRVSSHRSNRLED